MTATMPTGATAMAKPVGARCNLSCAYCFYVDKDWLHDAPEPARMSDATLELYIRHQLANPVGNEVEFAWQGGEPTLAGLDFFGRVVTLQRRWAQGRPYSNVLQTNGMLLDDDWGSFLAEHDFLVGISIDGPAELHDRWRQNRGGGASHARVMRGIDVLHRHDVRFNTLTVVHRDNADHGAEVYRFLRDLCSFLQFIPVVERVPAAGGSPVGPHYDGATRPSDATVVPTQYGRFLCDVFDEWVHADVGTVFVQAFDEALAAWVGSGPRLCIHSETCGDQLIVEHNGDVYSCDHYVYPAYKLGNLHETSLVELARSPQQVAFGTAKRDALPVPCRRCNFRFACNGGCPKHRWPLADGSGVAPAYLCRGYQMFYRHAGAHMAYMARCIAARTAPARVMAAARDGSVAVGRNDPCVCRSGRKHKRCCG